MKLAAAVCLALLLGAGAAAAQPSGGNVFTVGPNTGTHCANWVSGNTVGDAGAPCGTSSAAPAGVAGDIQDNNGSGNFGAAALNDNGTIVKSTESIDTKTNATVWEIPNAASTGTAVNKLAKLTGAPSTAVSTGTGDAVGAIGIVVGGAGTAGSAQIAITGQASCVFDGATTAGDYVINSATAAGDCSDAGALPPDAKTSVGIVLTTNASGGTYGVSLFPPTPSNIAVGGLGFSTSQVHTFTAAQRAAVVSLTISTATYTPNFNTGQNFTLTLVHASCPCTLANPSTTPVAGQSGVFEIIQSSTGSDTITTWGSDYTFAGGTSTIALSTGANARDYFSYYVADSTHIVLSAGALNASH